jgi:ABC-type transport system substrate-binding protein
MRLMRHFAVSVGLGVLLLGSAAAGAGVLVTAAPAQAAATNPPGGGATGSVDPSTATPGSPVTFQVFCASLDTASATLFGETLGLPEQIPMDKESGAGVFSATITLPNHIRPGTYAPDMDCSDGSSATATLTVTAIPRPGGVQTGDGTTSTETNTGLATSGVALAGVGVLTGSVGLRRRYAARHR